MNRLAIVVEGETEEEFVKSVLAPHLQTRAVEATPHLIGGNVTVERLASEMANLFWSYDRVTSFVDFYGFPNRGQVWREDLETRIHRLIRTSNVTGINHECFRTCNSMNSRVCCSPM